MEKNSNNIFKCLKKYPRKMSLNDICDENYGLINKKTKITSIGSCFARHISNYLKNNDYNYVITEKSNEGFSAAYGRIYNPEAIKQVFLYSEGLFNPNSYDKKWNYLFRDPREKEFNWTNHIKATKKAFDRSDLAIITLGLIETWKKDEKFLNVTPPREQINDFEFHVLTYYEVLESLNEIKELYNKPIIFTVSPIPLLITFRQDINVVLANNYSKSILLSAVKKLVSENENLYYFPSYEIVMNLSSQKFTNDNRHPSNESLSLVIKGFEQMFVK